MAGPGAQVLFATAATPSWEAALDGMIDLVKSGERKGDSFWIGTTRPIGGFYEGEGRPFLVSIGTELPWEESLLTDSGETPAFYERPFGFRPDMGVTLNAMSNQPQDHRILGELALAVAKRLGGIIDLCGLIVPREVPFEDRQGAAWSAVQPKVEAFTAALPGKAVATPYTTISEREWASHTVDAEFLRAWLCHPEFHMIK